MMTPCDISTSILVSKPSAEIIERYDFLAFRAPRIGELFVSIGGNYALKMTAQNRERVRGERYICQPKELADRGPWFLTYTGKKFYPGSPKAEDICIEDIAHALSLVNRFGGHTRVPYSVAQHSVLVAALLPSHLMFQGLMHDAAEAYCGDVVKPLKGVLPDYQKIEAGIWEVVANKFHLPIKLECLVKDADLRALRIEQRSYMNDPEGYCVPKGMATPELARPWNAVDAELRFLSVFHCARKMCPLDKTVETD